MVSFDQSGRKLEGRFAPTSTDWTTLTWETWQNAG
jgi:hypothetical protein